MTRILAMCALCATLLAAAGCGGDGGGAETGATEVVARDFAFDPRSASVAGQAVRLRVVNRGEAPHALAIEAPASPRTPTTEPGGSATLAAELEPGTYEWYCPVGDHRRRGMTGTLTVGGAGGGAPHDAPASPSFGY
ncbi:MAG TPA: cupredoxin domain-containing protein [Solirubrobacteraceae bacterium]|nr:cupredoxin domain-containing protein [Solirubrobacteraceae bacterium]